MPVPTLLLPCFPISSSSRLVLDDLFQQATIHHSVYMLYPFLFTFLSSLCHHVYVQFSPYVLISYPIPFTLPECPCLTAVHQNWWSHNFAKPKFCILSGFIV